jgi:LysM repeat protein
LTEDIRLDLSKNDSTLTEQFNQRRVDEIQELLSRGHEAEVEFSGIWQDQAGSNWMIAGLIVEITGDTQIEGTIKLLDRVKVRARTIADGRIVAIGIQPDSTKNDITPDEPLPTPTPSATSTATASSTSTPTAISSPTPTPTMTVTASLIPSPSATLCVAEEPDGWATYIVQPGDTLTQIAERAGITLNQLMDVNCLSDPNYLIAGWHLYAPAAPQDTSSFPTELSPGDDGHDDNGDDSPDVDSHD